MTFHPLSIVAAGVLLFAVAGTFPCNTATFGPSAAGCHGTSSTQIDDPTGSWAVSFIAGDDALYGTSATMAHRAGRGGS